MKCPKCGAEPCLIAGQETLNRTFFEAGLSGYKCKCGNLGITYYVWDNNENPKHILPGDLTGQTDNQNR